MSLVGQILPPSNYWVGLNHHSLWGIPQKLTMEEALWGRKVVWPNWFEKCYILQHLLEDS